MTDRPTDFSSLPSYRPARRSLFAARKFALMASVVAGLGAAVYGFGPSHGPIDVFTTAAHAQVDKQVRQVAQPAGFADIVERVKPSVISVKVNIAEKVAKNDSGDNNDDFTVPAGLADGALLQALWRSRWFTAGHARWPAWRPRRGHWPRVRLLHFG